MATTHVFIVDANTFKYHLEYMFAGTGAENQKVDFISTPNVTKHRGYPESSLTGMIADSQRVRIGDLVIFYLQQNLKQGIHEGKFYGVFKISSLSFLDDDDGQQYLKTNLEKSLTFRSKIEPYQVYTEGVTEWEALDEIQNIQAPCQMLWSLIYRKLKGNRGNTMITIYESERFIRLIRNKNNQNVLDGNSFTFNSQNQRIERIDSVNNYVGRQTTIDILPRLIYKYNRGYQFEAHLQAYLTQNIDKLPFLNNEQIEWIGNEVSCGVGMQRIDIMLSTNSENRKVIPIELKSTEGYPDITLQIKRYVDWIEQYYIPNRPSDIEPMIIARENTDKTSPSYTNFINALKTFNNRNNTLKLRYIEFGIRNNTILFNEITY